MTGDGRTIFFGFPGWTSVRLAEVGNAQSFDRASLHARARSASYAPKEGPAGHDLHAALDALFTEHSRNDKVTMRMKTTATIAGT
ncbi:MAG: putative methyltransferase [Candidatus Eremiobacteraeota bacterium]|nr:putative methyltransferase [Candidatus Eremiobacteraeota bacterium]